MVLRADDDYSGPMTYYFETPNDKAAHVRGITTEAYEAEQDAIVRFREEFGEADADPEDRRYVDEGDVILVTEQDRRDLQVTLDWEEFNRF